MVSNCLSALVEIVACEGGIVINKKIAHYLLNRSDSRNIVGVVLQLHQDIESICMFKLDTCKGRSVT